VSHTLLGGIEISRQRTTDQRNTGYFGNTATTLAVPASASAVSANVTFRQSATDADNNSHVDVAALYVQDQATLGPVQLVAGVRVERFGMRFHNIRTNADLARDDQLISPRIGVVLKPTSLVSLYATRSVSHLPSSGDQFSSLTVTTQTLEPEHFENLEVGVKWDALDRVALTAAVYQLDRTNSQAPDPLNPGKVVQTGARRTNGLELTASGDVTRKLSMVAGYALQDARIVETTTAAAAGSKVQMVPRNSMSLWSRYQVSSAFGLGAGMVSQSKTYAAIDNAVALPGFTRFDAALFARIGRTLRAQVNAENLLNSRYYATAHNNNNIMPGAPRSVVVSVSVSR
jgi:catecholate siderophore receptor